MKIKNYTEFVNESLISKADAITLVDIRSSLNSFSSTDKKLYAIGDKTNDIQNYYTIAHTLIDTKEINGKMVKLINLTLAGAFRQEWSKELKNEVFNKLLKAGFIQGYPDEIQDALAISYKNRLFVDSKTRQDAGYVLWMDNPKTKDYVGGFSLETFFDEYLISYVENGVVFGYIGHRSRKNWVDQLMEKLCLTIIKPDDFACWLTSTAARHFMDKISDMIESDDKPGVENFIKENLNKIHDQSVIFNYPGHGGSLKDSLELFDKLSSAGLMKNDKYDYGW